MGNFFKTVFASCLGVLLAGFAMIFIGSAMIGSLASSLVDSPKSVGANSILSLSFNQVIPERTNNVPTDPFQLDNEPVMGLHDYIGSISHAKENDNIKGILLDLGTVTTGGATNKLIREALVDFKSSGKFVVAYSKYYSQNAYYLASVADEIYVNPLGGVDFLGVSVQIPFFKDMLDRMDIKMQVFYAGQFKSATEPFRRYDISDQNRLQIREYMEDIYGQYLEEISVSRNISTAELRRIADQYLLRKAEDAVEHKLVDGLAYRDELIDNLKGRIGLEEDDKLKVVRVTDYGNKKKKGGSYSVNDKIAVVYAEGSIVDGKGEAGNIGGDKYAKIIRKIRQDDNVRAIVLRVNSPGGSATASDIMWRELILAQKQGIPVVASFSNVAASGGYYISCAADSIFAEPNSITGSIGVFAMIPSLQNTFKNKLGITTDTVKLGRFSNRLSLLSDITAEESAILQEGVEDIYETFLKRVADGRKMSRDEVHAIAQGRVWTGKKAMENGLVDALGGIDEAIASAATLAEIKEYRLTEYPKIKNPFERMLEDITKKPDTDALARMQLGDYYPYFEYLKEIKNMKGVQARMPFMIIHE